MFTNYSSLILAFYAMLGLLSLGVVYCFHKRVYTFKHLLVCNWMIIGLVSIVFILVSPLVQIGAIFVFDICEIATDIFNSEDKFNRMIGEGPISDIIYPCLFSENKNLLQNIPVTSEIGKID